MFYPFVVTINIIYFYLIYVKMTAVLTASYLFRCSYVLFYNHHLSYYKRVCFNLLFSLISEVKNLEEQLKTLNYQLDCARTGHLGLQEARLQLEDEARIKRKTLWIDCIRCQTVRAHYPSLNVLIGH